ncbi:hypothetical protein WVI01_10370 [Weissella viridescens]|uniref:Transposase and inactivated derivatives n=1 Tax=Weissella viridescens TaxID=1629 RepID=A0A0R2GYX9_WEIVI|nr:alpha/beta hydrolase [Weissella viridescens]KRN45977.1 hypothetical protein IV50_GL001320 [Weissella viridescens]GEA95114.1 hypothetical protein WVI01_10370 [Weissella viridescens]SUP60869.1 Transposase and inactivated derivatives [Weissella viridescens]
MINTEEITLKARHFNLAGRLFFPENFDKSIAHPAIVVTHPTSADMNQTSSIYATKLAENGFLTLAYDAATKVKAKVSHVTSKIQLVVLMISCTPLIT